MPTRLRYSQIRLADDTSDQALPGQIANAIPSSITEEDYQRFFLSRLREVIFGLDTSKHWYTDLISSGVVPLATLGKRRVGIHLVGTADGVNRTFQTPDKFLHDLSNTGQTIEVWHNGRRLIQSPLGDVRQGDYYVDESGGPGTGYDTIKFLSFTPVGASIMVADYLAL